MKKRIYLSFVILLLPFVAFADDYTSTVFNILNPSALQNGTDLSIDYLQNIFGVVDGVLHGSGSQIMGQMFMIFNAGALVLGGIIIIYTMLVSTLNTAHEGEVLGRKWSSIWIPVRSALGIGLLIPKATGYSVIQIFMMWAIVQGVGLADSVWNAATNYLSQGGVIVQQALKPKGDISKATQNIFRSEVCLYGLQRILNNAFQNNIQSNPPPVPDITSSVFNQKLCLADNCVIGFPGGRKLSNGSYPDGLKDDTSSNPPIHWSNLNGICGTVQWDTKGLANNASQALGSNSSDAPISQLLADTASQQTTSTNQLALALLLSRQVALNQVFSDFAGPALQVIDGWYPSGAAAPSTTNPANYLQSRMFLNTGEDYEGITYPADRAYSNSSILSGISHWIKSAQSQGWISAGSYYQDMANINDNAGEADYGQSVPTGTDIGSYPNNIATLIVQTYPFVSNSDAQALKNLITDKSNNLNTFISNAPTTDSSYGGRMPTLPSVTGAVNQTIGGLSILADLVSPIIGPLLQILTGFISLSLAQASNTNPVIALAMMGSGMISLVVEVWVIGAVTMAGVTGALGLIPSVTISNSILSFLQWVIPFLWAILGLLFVEGTVLSFYVPLIPFILFTFGAIGWLINVIEAMVAAPLVALGITHPEGAEVLGKADPAVLLLVNVFLRPSMMIIGLIAGIIMSYVSVWLLNAGFFGAFFNAMINNVSGLALLFSIPALLIVYTVIVIALVNQSFSLINVVPDKVLRWIGGHVEGVAGEAGKMLGETQQGYRSGMQGMQSGIGKSIEAAGARADKRSTGDATGTSPSGTPSDLTPPESTPKPPGGGTGGVGGGTGGVGGGTGGVGGGTGGVGGGTGGVGGGTGGVGGGMPPVA